MALEKLKEEYTYKSPDGDAFKVSILTAADRKYIEIGREDGDPIAYDAQMIIDLAEIIKPQPKTVYRDDGVLTARPTMIPTVTDHRPVSTPIDRSVAKTMENIKDDTVPIQSLEAPVQEIVSESNAPDVKGML